MSQNPFAIYDNHPSPSRKRRSASVRREVDIIPVEEATEKDQRAFSRPGTQFAITPLAVSIVVVMAVFFARLLYLQVLQGNSYRSLAEQNRTHTEVEKALRGVLYDQSGKQLVKNIPNFTLVLNPDAISFYSTAEYQLQREEIVAATGLPATEIDAGLNRARESQHTVILREHIPYEEALQLVVRLEKVASLEVLTYYAREYSEGDAFGHLIGYTGKISEVEYQAHREEEYLFTDDIGKAGIEKSHETDLRGSDGYVDSEVDAQGNKQTIISERPAVSGNNLHLTIDSALQQRLYDELQRVVEQGSLPGASAIAIDPRDGSILALVSYPSYNSNAFSSGISNDEYKKLIEDERNPLFHRAISGEYPSGSTFKPVVAAAALEEGIITPSTTVESTGGVTIDRFFFPDWKSGGHGTTNVIKALAESVNTFFYLIGGGDNETNTGLGVERITEYAKRFSFGSTTGIDLPGEAEGFLPSKAWKEEFKDEPWYIGDTYHLAIGQGDILVTPLQIALMTATLANGGTLYQPHVVDHITNAAGETIQIIEPTVLRSEAVSSRSVRVVQQGLREAVLTGSARSLQSLPVTSAGKTGTAQFGTGEKTHSWFTAFAPYENPEIAITVMVEEAGGGNDAALPIARTALNQYFSRD